MHPRQPTFSPIKKYHYGVHVLVYRLIIQNAYLVHKNEEFCTLQILSKYIFQLFAIPNFLLVLQVVLAFLPTGAQRGRPMMKKTMEMARMTRVLWGLRVGYWSMTPVRTVSNMANYIMYNQKLNRFIHKLII